MGIASDLLPAHGRVRRSLHRSDPDQSLSSCKRLHSGSMKRTDLSRHPCSIARALDAAGEWWTPLILRDVAYGIGRFREIQEDLGISANVLSDRLETLVAEGLLETRVYQSRPERHEYRLTEKGRDLVPPCSRSCSGATGGRGPTTPAPSARCTANAGTSPRRGALPALRARAGAERARRGAERSRWRRARAGRAGPPVGAPARREPGAWPEPSRLGGRRQAAGLAEGRCARGPTGARGAAR